MTNRLAILKINQRSNYKIAQIPLPSPSEGSKLCISKVCQSLLAQLCSLVAPKVIDQSIQGPRRSRESIWKVPILPGKDQQQCPLLPSRPHREHLNLVQMTMEVRSQQYHTKRPYHFVVFALLPGKAADRQNICD